MLTPKKITPNEKVCLVDLISELARGVGRYLQQRDYTSNKNEALPNDYLVKSLSPTPSVS